MKKSHTTVLQMFYNENSLMRIFRGCNLNKMLIHRGGEMYLPLSMFTGDM